MKQPVIKIATMNEFDAIQHLFRQMFDLFTEHQNPDYPFTEHGITYLTQSITQQSVYVAKQGEQVIGFLIGAIGRLLVEAFIAHCRTQQIPFIHTDSDVNQALMNFF